MKDSYKELTPEELKVKRAELAKQYDEVSFNGVIGHLDNPLSKRTVRRRLARVTTLLREHELGIRKRQGA
jgi:large subunit ribosomal protein L29